MRIEQMLDLKAFIKIDLNINKSDQQTPSDFKGPPLNLL